MTIALSERVSATPAVAHARRHRPRRGTEGRGQGHHRPRRRRARLRHAGAHQGSGDPRHPAPARQSTPPWTARLSLKRAVVDKFKRDNGLDYTPDQILVSCGGKQSFFNLCQALLNPGDEVIVPAPYWVSYPEMVPIAGGTPVMVYAAPSSITSSRPRSWSRPSRHAPGSWSSTARPTPPAWPTAAPNSLAFGEVLQHHPHVIIATDDMYEHLHLARASPSATSSWPALTSTTARVVLNGVSKAYAMTGWRIGYAGGPLDLIKAMTNVQSQSTSNPASISQAAAEAALTGDQQCVQRHVQGLSGTPRYSYITTLKAMPGVRVLPADGTFFSFPDFSAVIARLKLKDDWTLVNTC